jgi:hypothetical protein
VFTNPRSDQAKPGERDQRTSIPSFNDIPKGRTFFKFRRVEIIKTVCGVSKGFRRRVSEMLISFFRPGKGSKLTGKEQRGVYVSTYKLLNVGNVTKWRFSLQREYA